MKIFHNILSVMKAILFLIVFNISLVSINAQSPKNCLHCDVKQYPDYAAIAKRLIQYQEYEAAEIVMNNIIEKNPDNFEALLEYITTKSLLYEHKGELEKAITLWEKYREKYKEDKTETSIALISRSYKIREFYLLSAINMLKRNKKYKDIIDYADKLYEFWLLEQDPFDIGYRKNKREVIVHYAHAYANYYKAEGYLGLQEYDQVINLCRSIVEGYPNINSLPAIFSDLQKKGNWLHIHVMVRILLAKAYMEKGDTGEAKKLFKEMNEIIPKKEFSDNISAIMEFEKMRKEEIDPNLKKCEALSSR